MLVAMCFVAWLRFVETSYSRVTSRFKQVTKNHLLGQVMGFRIGDTEDRHDDLLDAFTYGVAISLGDYEGF